MSMAKRLREMINSGELIMAPGAYDVWSALIIQKVGFPAVYMTGYGVSASMIGKPDIGLMSFAEVSTMARSMAMVLDIPLIADADTGFGNCLNVVRCVEEYEAAGVAAIQLEDQVMPKRCGHMDGKGLVSTEDMVSKIRAAVHTRKDPDFVIIARTDARAVIGLEEAICRAKAYIQAGADVIFIEAPQSEEEVRCIGKALKAPLMANIVEKGKTPCFTAHQLEEMGYSIAIYPVTALYAATRQVAEAMNILKQTGSISETSAYTCNFPEFNRMIGLDELRTLEKSFVE